MAREDYKSYDDLPLMLSVKELGAVLGVSRTSAYELVQSKEIPSVKAGSRKWGFFMQMISRIPELQMNTG